MRTFLAQARGSAYELETQLQLSADLQFIEAEIAGELLGRCNEVSKMLNAFSRLSMRRSVYEQVPPDLLTR